MTKLGPRSVGERSAWIKEQAIKLGFSSCGIAKAGFLEDEAPRLEKWLKLGMNGKMSYMNNRFDKRLDSRELIDGAKSVISLLHSYYSDLKPTDPTAPRIAKYAYGKDYHRVLKKKLKRLLEMIRSEIGEINGQAFVDSEPILERAWARRAGLGWTGKNSVLLTREQGSFFFLSELVVDLELEYDQPYALDHCAKCTLCIDGCPTGAIVEPRVVDATKCISYLTIELSGDLPTEMAGKFQNWMFGCDICQDVCPWNRKAKPHEEPEFEPEQEMLEMTNEEWHELTKDAFNRLFSNSAVRRTRFRGLKRNIKFLQLKPRGEKET